MGSLALGFGILTYFFDLVELHLIQCMINALRLSRYSKIQKIVIEDDYLIGACTLINIVEDNGRIFHRRCCGSNKQVKNGPASRFWIVIHHSIQFHIKSTCEITSLKGTTSSPMLLLNLIGHHFLIYWCHYPEMATQIQHPLRKTWRQHP